MEAIKIRKNKEIPCTYETQGGHFTECDIHVAEWDVNIKINPILDRTTIITTATFLNILFVKNTY